MSPPPPSRASAATSAQVPSVLGALALLPGSAWSMLAHCAGCILFPGWTYVTHVLINLFIYICLVIHLQSV